MAAQAARFAFSRVRDLSGALGARHGKPKRRPGDPITPEELIDDRSLAAKLLGAGVFFIALVAIGAFALVQLGKLEIPWLHQNSLPAATASSSEMAAADDDASGSSVSGAGVGVLIREGEEESSTGLDDGNASADVPGAEGWEGSEGALSPEVLEFTRLQGDLAFRMGEYEIVRAEFGEDRSGCAKLTAHWASVDSSHLALSRVVARWREVPYRQIKAYEGLSASLDEMLLHYAASGCGLDPDQLP